MTMKRYGLVYDGSLHTRILAELEMGEYITFDAVEELLRAVAEEVKKVRCDWRDESIGPCGQCDSCRAKLRALDLLEIEV